MTTLTDRYVWAVVRSLPERQRADIERELRASISDAVEAKIEDGPDAAAAESAVLTELGDPARLAANYADRPAYLIGPARYFDYLRILRLLLIIVIPASFGGLILAGMLKGEQFGQAIGGATVTSITVAVQLSFWVTLAFVILDRVPSRNRGLGWNVGLLPQLPAPRSTGTGKIISAVIGMVCFVGVVFWQQGNSPFSDASGDPIPLLQQGLWPLWLPYFFAIVALEVVFAVVVYLVGRWTMPLLAVRLVLTLAALFPAIWLFTSHLVFNQAFFDSFEFTAKVVDGPVTIGALLIAVFSSVFAVFEALRDAVQSRRSSPVAI